MPRTNLKIRLWSQIHLAPLRDQQGNLMRIIGVQGRLEEEPGDGLEELMAKQCVVTEPCDAESLRTSAVDTVRSPRAPPLPLSNPLGPGFLNFF